MRIVLTGASSLSVATARVLLERGDEVVLVEKDHERIAALSDEIDCSFVHGDGTRPSVLEELSPKDIDLLLCLSDSDQNNIIAAMVGQALKIKRVQAKIDNPEFEPICHRLGLKNTIVPDREVGRSLADLIEGHEDPGRRATTSGDLRFFAFTAGERDAGKVEDLELPDGSRVIWVARGDKAEVAAADTRIEAGDEVQVLARRRDMDALAERFESNGDGSSAAVGAL